MRAKVLLLFAVCMAVVVGAELPGSSAEKARGVSKERTSAPEIGVSVAHPASWHVEREKYEYEGTRGFTLWKDTGGAVEADGGRPAARVALAPDLTRGQIEGKVRERISEFPDLDLSRQNVTVGERKLEGVAVGPIPGSTPYTEVYVPVDGRVYRVNLYGVKLDAAGKSVLASLEFDAPTRSRSALSAELPNAGDPKTFYKSDGEAADLAKREQAARQKSSTETTRSSSPTRARVPAYAEERIAEGCWLAASSFFVQTQQGYLANRYANDPGTDAPTGFAAVGVPNFWGQYTHGNLGYGRCASTYYTNDMYAVDYPLNGGDVVFSPFRSGTVTFAGRNSSHSNYGIFVVIRDANGKYVSMSAHLSGLAPGIRRGATVTSDSIIGYAGSTGDPSIPVGEVHLHQAFYRYPAFLSDGSPYGGQGLKVGYHHYTGYNRNVSPGVYRFVRPGADTQATITKWEAVGN